MKIFILAISMAFSFASAVVAQNPTTLQEYFQSKNIAPKTLDDMFYLMERQGNGATPKRGDYVKMHFTGKLLDGTVFDESKGEPLVFRLGYRQVIQGWELGIPQFKVGGKGSLFVPPNKAYGNRTMGKVPANSPLIFDIQVLEILNEAAYEKYNTELEKREKIAFDKKQKEILQQDIQKIIAYASENKIKATSTKSGLHYAITKKGKGEFPKNGDLISAEYEGFLTDGTAFDSNKGKEAFQFVLGAKKVMEGWEEGFSFFNKGSEGYLLIPSALAYKGTAIADRGIPANAVLVFKIKTKEIKKK